MPPEEVPVAIIGGGLIGLAMSALLSRHGVQHVLFEKHPSTSPSPKAISIHMRSMEIMRKIDEEVAAHLYAYGAPPEHCVKTSWFTSFDKKESDADSDIWGREISSRGGFGYILDDGERGRAHRLASPNHHAYMPQLRLEPILLRKVEELNPGGIFMSHQVDAVEEYDDHVEIKYHATAGAEAGASRNIKATYVVAADGGRLGLTDRFCNGWQGESDLVDMWTAHFRAPLSKYEPDPSALISWLVNPSQGGSLNSGVTYPLGPWPNDRSTEEWLVIIARKPQERGKEVTQEQMVDRLRDMYRIPDLPLEMLGLSEWHLNAKYATNYVSDKGNIFMVGDSAHQIPPWGGIGANTGYQDAENLSWKLAWALKYKYRFDPAGLLKSYETERSPIGRTVAMNSLSSFRAHGGAVDRALGLSPEKSEEENMEEMRVYFNEAATGEEKNARDTKREAVHRATQETLDSQFCALGLEAGITYDYSWLCDGVNGEEKWHSPQLAEDGGVKISEYHPTTMPGHQLPHAWIMGGVSKQKLSTRYLVGADKFLIIAGSEQWKKIGHPLIEVVSIHEEGDYRDPDGAWAAQREVGASGAVLVRPDNLVGYRWTDDAVLREDDDYSGMIDRLVERMVLYR